MYFYHPDERQAMELREGIQARTFWGADLMLAVVDLDAHAVLPTHNHPQEQGGIVLQGELDFTVAGETRRLRPGDVYMIPGGLDHSVTLGPLPARVLDIFHPIREEFKY
jgi:quercetin dioxygenase-like cupin family protein